MNRTAALRLNTVTPLPMRLVPLAVFAVVLIGHALYVRHISAAPTDGFADMGISDNGAWGFPSYFAAGDYWLGLSYSLCAAFTTWAAGQFFLTRRAAMAAGALGSVTLVGVLMAGGCFLLGCCGSPMLSVYVALFGAKVLGVGSRFSLLSRSFRSHAVGGACRAARSAHRVARPMVCAASSLRGQELKAVDLP